MDVPPGVACLDTRHPRRLLAPEQVPMRFSIYDRPSVRLPTSGRTLSQHSVRTGRGLFTFPTSSYHRPRCCGVGLSFMAFVIPDATPGSGGMFPPLVVRAGDLMKGAE